MKKKINQGLTILGGVTAVFLAIILFYLMFAQPNLDVQLLVEPDGVIQVKSNELVDVFFVLRNQGIRSANIENVFIYDKNTMEGIRLAASYPKHHFKIWPKDEKLIHMQIPKPLKTNQINLGINIAYTPSTDLLKSDFVAIEWKE